MLEERSLGVKMVLRGGVSSRKPDCPDTPDRPSPHLLWWHYLRVAEGGRKEDVVELGGWIDGPAGDGRTTLN